MPEGKLRSRVYRSFIMCDDPRGVVECGTIKKQSKSSNICSSNNQRFYHPKKAKERSSEDVDASRSSLQLLRVSKKVQKLNVAIDSWSKGLIYEATRPEDIAKDLLRGALDLEESLAMLSSIQEDDIKQKRRFSKDGRHDLRFQRSLSDRFGERIEMIQEENVESRDCYDELRKVIKESFLRQNLLPQTKSTETKTRVVSRKDFTSSSTSSSQSSMVSSSTKSSASSGIPRRAPNLIARLMGLDVSSQEPSKSTVNHVDDKLSLERQEQLKKTNKKESAETVRCNSTSEAVLQIPNENPSAIVQIRPMRVVKPEKEEKPVNKRPVLPRMQEEIHPRMRKNYQGMEVNRKSSKKMKLPPSLSKKDREPKGMVRRVEENEGKVIKLMSPSNVKAVTRESKEMETNKKLSLKKLDNGEGQDRYRPHDRALKPPNKPVSQKKTNSSSDMSRNKSRRSSSSSSEQRSSTREKKSDEASRASAKKKLHKQENDLASENNSGSSEDTLGSINQLSSVETTSSEFHIQGHCDNGEVSSSDEPRPSQISLRSFLSSSSDFISYTQKLFHLNTNTKRSQESAFQNKDSIVTSDQRLALDFGKEVARRKSLLLLTKPTCPQRSSLHIDELLMEVCNGFESLRSYRDTFLEQSSFVKESVHMVLEKDLKSKKTDMTSGVWDLGWRSEFLINETHQAVVDLEKLILSGLIQEIIS